MFEAIGQWGLRLARGCPWTNVYGVARSILATATLATLAFSSSTALFHPAFGLPPPPYCEGTARISLFCLVPQMEVARWLSVGILLIVASGWRPRWTAIPHWWITFSFQVSASIPDGGDQLSSILTLLLVPVALTDGRRWHWLIPGGDAHGNPHREILKRIAAQMAFLVVRLQVAYVYFDSAVTKFRVEEWANGTAMYYWLLHSSFGVPHWMRGPAHLLTTHALSVALLTWGIVLFELCLAISPLLPPRARWFLLRAGIAFHCTIAILMGLISFSLVMIAALLLFLQPVDQALTLPARRRIRVDTAVPIPDGASG
jgi:antimicrobial peptide system SdpB family protein